MKKKSSLAACSIIIVGFLLLSICSSSSSATGIQWPGANPLEPNLQERNVIDTLFAENSENSANWASTAGICEGGELPQSQNDYLQILYPNGGETVSG
ncbi:MAG: hypothetical protein ACXAEI_19285, partial [Candidatus Hodarchaeales archaeon]